MLNQLKPGFIYLVKGNLNTLRWLLRDVEIEPVVYPTTHDYYEQVSYLSPNKRCVVFVVGTDKVTSRSNSPDAIPDVKFGTIDTKSYFFLVPDGITLTDPKPLYKKLAGGQYREVDLGSFAKEKTKHPCCAYKHQLEGLPAPEVSYGYHLQQLLWDTFNGTEPAYYRWRNQNPSLLHSLYRPEYFDRACHFCKDLLPYARVLLQKLNKCTTSKAMHLLGLFGYFLSRSFKLTISSKNGYKFYNLTSNNKLTTLWKTTIL